VRAKHQKQAVPPTPTSIAPDVSACSNDPQRRPHRQVDARPVGQLDFVGLRRDSGLDDPVADAGTLTPPDERVDYRERRP